MTLSTTNLNEISSKLQYALYLVNNEIELRNQSHSTNEVSEETRDYDRRYREAWETQIRLNGGTSFGQAVAGNGPLEKYQEGKEVRRRYTECPHCNGKLTD